MYVLSPGCDSMTLVPQDSLPLTMNTWVRFSSPRQLSSSRVSAFGLIPRDCEDNVNEKLIQKYQNIIKMDFFGRLQIHVSQK